MSAPEAPAAFQATFCGMRTVASRQVTQITVEVPIEHTGHVLKVVGTPNGKSPQWVVIALLTEEAAAAIRAQASKATKETGGPQAAPASGKRWNDLSLAQRAGIRCNEVAFWRFLEEEACVRKDAIQNAQDAAHYLRYLCEVNSRAELDTVPKAAQAFRLLSDRFDAWRIAA